MRDKAENEENVILEEKDMLKKLSLILLEQIKKQNIEKRNVKIQKILTLLGYGALLTMAITMPNSPRLLKSFIKEESDWNEWKQFNPVYLRQTIRRLQKEKIISISVKNGIGIVEITEKGKKKILRYGLETITIPKTVFWDGKWRMVFYDVLNKKNKLRDEFRRYLKNMGFYPWQESVYISPYPCEKEIAFLKHYLGIGGEVTLVTAEKIENDQPFKEYFALS